MSRAALSKSEAARIDSTKMVNVLRSKFDKIIAEIIAENKTLVRAAENRSALSHSAQLRVPGR